MYAMLEAGNEEDWWNELNNEEKKEIDTAIEESENQNNLIPYETFQSEFKNMAQRVIILKKNRAKSKKVYAYLLENWNQKVADEFYEKFEKIIHIISLQPKIGRASGKRTDIRRKLITKHNCLYYKIKEDLIIVINLLDTRRNPNKKSL